MQKKRADDEQQRVLKELEACSLRQMEEIRSLRVALESARKDCDLKDAEIARLRSELKVALEANEELRRRIDELTSLRHELEHMKALLDVRTAEVMWLRELVMRTTAAQQRPQLAAPAEQTAPPPPQEQKRRLRDLLRL